MTTAQVNFINHEIAVWGEDYIHDLLDRGYEPVLVCNQEGDFKWTWILPIQSGVSQTRIVSA